MKSYMHSYTLPSSRQSINRIDFCTICKEIRHSFDFGAIITDGHVAKSNVSQIIVELNSFGLFVDLKEVLEINPSSKVSFENVLKKGWGYRPIDPRLN